MGFLQDAIKVFKKKDITFLEKRKEAEDVYSFLFQKDPEVTWNAGQHGLFRITHRKVKTAILPFTVASAPSEPVIQITTKIRPESGDFKKALLELEPGMKAQLSGPVGPFRLHGDSPALLIAGGIGITPFRAMLKQLEAEGGRGRQPIRLLYMDSGKTHIFQDELNEISGRGTAEIVYLDTRDGLQQEIGRFVSQYDNAKYYIAGPKSMIQDVAAHLQSKAVTKKNILKDEFFGY